jgi:molybdopterin-guanine dinucleotide biosynthesis protein A
LAAVAAGADALRRLGHRGAALVVATDLPRLSHSFLQLLIDWMPGPDVNVVPRDANGRAQPLCARYSAAALVRAAELVAAGRRSMGALLDAVPLTWIDGTGHLGVLWDVDTPDDLASMNAADRR